MKNDKFLDENPNSNSSSDSYSIERTNSLSDLNKFTN